MRFPGLGLAYFKNRFYDPALGRFLSPDPLGMVDGPNLYAYVLNDPINNVDPWGTSCYQFTATLGGETIARWTQCFDQDFGGSFSFAIPRSLFDDWQNTVNVVAPRRDNDLSFVPGQSLDYGSANNDPFGGFDEQPVMQAIAVSNSKPAPTCTANKKKHDLEVSKIGLLYTSAGKLATPNVTFEHPVTGQRAVADLVISNITFPLPEPYLVIEVKTGRGRLERGQLDVYSLVAGTGGKVIPRGLNALRAGFLLNVPVKIGTLSFHLRDGC